MLDMDYYRDLAYKTPQLINDTPGIPAYAVKIKSALVEPGEWYWQLALVHFLAGKENHGQQHLFIELLDEAGQPIRRPFNEPVIAWDWEGRQPWEAHPSFGPDKSLAEPGGNIGIHWGQRIEAWITLDGLKSDRVYDVHTMWPDGEDGNNRGHVSGLAIFVKRKFQAGPIPVEPPGQPPAEPDRVAKLIADIETVLSFYKSSNVR